MGSSTSARVHVSAHAQRSSASVRAPFRGAGREVQAWDRALSAQRAPETCGDSSSGGPVAPIAKNIGAKD
jgi:hypothetical protein